MADFYKINPLVVLGIPTLRKSPLSWEWHDVMRSLQFPLGAATAMLRIGGEYVADARNYIAKYALEVGADYVLFVSDDVLPPANIFSLLWRHKKHLVTGVYWTKNYPHEPYIWRDILRGPHLDWKYGEFFKVDWSGMDAILVHTDVFRKIEYPYFSHDWTWREGEPRIPLATEDVYFFSKTRKAGFDLWCDSAVQCAHQDRETLLAYGLSPDMPQHTAYVANKPKVNDKLYVADLGCGHWTPYFQNAMVKRFDINPEAKPDVLCDIRAIPEHDETFDVVRAHHVLEHFFFYEVKDIVSEWVRILKIGGELEIAVPNLAWAAREVIRSSEDDNHDATYAFGMIYGTRPDVKATEENHNQIHRMGFTRNGLARLLGLVDGLGNVEVAEGGNGALDGERTLVARATKTVSTKPLAILPQWEKTERKERREEINVDELASESIKRGAIQKKAELAGLIGYLRNRQLKTIVEIGTARGGTFWLWCRLADEDATIVSVDLPGGEFGGGYSNEDAEKFKSYAKRGQSLYFVRKNSQTLSTRDEIKSVLGDKQIDLLMIDGDHRYEGVKTDWLLYSPLVAKDGLIIFHDILFHPNVPECQVDKLWSEVKDKFKHHVFVDENDKTWGGIGVIERGESPTDTSVIDLADGDGKLSPLVLENENG